MLAVGSSDNNIYVYNTNEATHKLNLKWRCSVSFKLMRD